ncbi:hypothetical protein SLEP1_g8734 [Rubroshorea leprosula]|uniref:Molybdenum cofactor sulfurase n=1 Tax=Rubroshorea leprosula TaxID=152421 RepID=A0AAV5I8P8_9ROSI|nr:hypothetical protein SLEP1_g8734 [Rubroshorea leprosula]
MPPPRNTEASHACFHGCCPTPFRDLPESQTTVIPGSADASRHDFVVATVSSLHPNAYFTNHESLPSFKELFACFNEVYPQFSQTNLGDRIRDREYYHLSLSKHVCLDYIGHGLFSFSQMESQHPVASSSSSPLPSFQSLTLEPSFFNISYKSVKLNSQILYGNGSQELEFESKLKKRIMDFMNISESDYFMVFTANQSSAFKLLAEYYPFQSDRDLLTVYDHESEAVKVMIDSSKKKGAHVSSAEFRLPNLGIQTAKLRKKMVSKKRKKQNRGLFVFPPQSRVTGSRYSYQWMTMARENGWHVMLDACALGPKDMETLGLSLFKPDFLICSFFKIVGENPSGFGCLFIKKSSASVLQDSTSTGVGIVSLVPASGPSQLPEESENEETQLKKTEGTNPKSEIKELETPFESRNSALECRGLDHADSLGQILISIRAKCLINWLVNALISLRHPNSEASVSAVKIYGPKITFDRGPAVAFNVIDWKGEKIDPALVQKLADRNNISLSVGLLQHVEFSDKHEEEREMMFEIGTGEEGGTQISGQRGDKIPPRINVVTVTLGLLTNFEDVYRLWAFVSRFLDADFVEKERWRYKALNQKTIEL